MVIYLFIDDMYFYTGSNKAHNPSSVSSSQMDTMEQASSPDSFMPDFNMTDYNPEDIDQINVNELLLQYNKNYT